MIGQAIFAWPPTVAELLIFGTAFFALTLENEGGAGACLRDTVRLWRALALADLVLAPAALMEMSAGMVQKGWLGALPLLPEILRRTDAGRVWQWRLPVTALMAAAAWAFPRRLRAIAMLLLSAALILADSLTSHAIDHGRAAVALYFVHMSAAGLWFGGIAGLLLAIKPQPDAPWLGKTIRRVSMLAGWWVLALAASGVALAYQTLGANLARLVDTAYGQTLLVKIALFAIVLAIGGYNRYRLVAASDESWARKTLVRTVGAECLLLLAALAAASLLANMAPPH